MRIVKKLNNSAALAIDDNGRELVVFGRGIGFAPTPYILTDLNLIERSFYDIKSSYIELAASLPEDIVMLAAEIVETAQFELDCRLNPNLPFTLADHLNFAMERLKQGVEIVSPLSYDVAHFYPKELAIGKRTALMVKEKMNVELPDSEITNIVLHFVNGELENSDMNTTLKATKIIAAVTAIVEQEFSIKLDTDSFHYSRFVMHIRYLIGRMEAGCQENIGMGSTLRGMYREYPDVYRCTCKVASYLEKEWNWVCNEDEKLFLLVYIKRIKERNENKI